MGQKGVT